MPITATETNLLVIGVGLYRDQIDAIPVKKWEGNLAVFQKAPSKGWFDQQINKKKAGQRGEDQRDNEKFLLLMSPELDCKKPE